MLLSASVLVKPSTRVPSNQAHLVRPTKPLIAKEALPPVVLTDQQKKGIASKFVAKATINTQALLKKTTQSVATKSTPIPTKLAHKVMKVM